MDSPIYALPSPARPAKRRIRNPPIISTPAAQNTRNTQSPLKQRFNTSTPTTRLQHQQANSLRQPPNIHKSPFATRTKTKLYQEIHNPSPRKNEINTTLIQHAREIIEEEEEKEPFAEKYEVFLDIVRRMKGREGGHKIMVEAAVGRQGVLDGFIETCDERIKELAERGAGIAGVWDPQDAEDIRNWTHEKHTWMLLRALLALRLTPVVKETINMELLPITSDLALASYLLDDKPQVAEAFAVKSWLENIYPKAEKVEARKSYFVSTRATLQLPSGSRKRLPTELDPDGPTRLGIQADHEDQEYDQVLCSGIWTYLRRGMPQDAKDLCKKWDHPWRSAILDGLLVYDDPNLRDDEEIHSLDDTASPIGNNNPALLMQMAYITAQETSIPWQERGIYAYICGDYENMRPLCSSWQDKLWAMYHCYMLKEIHSCLKRYARPKWGIQTSELPRSLDNSLERRTIFDRAANASLPRLEQAEGQEFYEYIQTSIILDQQKQIIKNMAEPNIIAMQQSHYLRFTSFYSLILRDLGVVTDDTSYVILKAYLSILRNEGLSYQTALLCRTLPLEDCVKYAAEYIQFHIKNWLMAESFAKALIQQNINLDSVVLTVVESLREKEANQFIGDQAFELHVQRNKNGEESAPDCIIALSFLTKLSDLRSDQLVQANAMIRLYALNGRLDLAGHIFSAVFIDAKRLLDDYPALKSHLKEYMELKELTKLYHAFIEFDKLVAKKPLESFFQTRYGGFTNAVERAEYETKIEKWTQDITQRLKALCSEIQQMVISDWMEDDVDGAELFAPLSSAPDRKGEMEILRSRYLPDLILKICGKLQNHTTITGVDNMYKEMIGCIDDSIKAEFARSGNTEALQVLLQEV